MVDCTFVKQLYACPKLYTVKREEISLFHVKPEETLANKEYHGKAIRFSISNSEGNQGSIMIGTCAEGELGRINQHARAFLIRKPDLDRLLSGPGNEFKREARYLVSTDETQIGLVGSQAWDYFSTMTVFTRAPCSVAQFRKKASSYILRTIQDAEECIGENVDPGTIIAQSMSLDGFDADTYNNVLKQIQQQLEDEKSGNDTSSCE